MSYMLEAKRYFLQTLKYYFPLRCLSCTILREQIVAEEPIDSVHDEQQRKHSDVTTRSANHRSARSPEVRSKSMLLR